MKITPVCGNSLYSIRFVEFAQSDGHAPDAYFELVTQPFKCLGIFATLDEAQAELQRLTNFQGNPVSELPAQMPLRRGAI